MRRIACPVCGTKFWSPHSKAKYCRPECFQVIANQRAVAKRKDAKQEAQEHPEGDDPPDVIERKLRAWEAYRKRHPLELDAWRTTHNQMYNPYFDTKGL